MSHLETRESKAPGFGLDVLVKVSMSRQALLLLLRSLRQSSALGGVTLMADNSVSIKGKFELLLLLNVSLSFAFLTLSRKVFRFVDHYGR